MRSKILYTAGSIAALLVVLTIFFSIRLEGFIRRNEAAVTKAEIEAAGAAVTFYREKGRGGHPPRHRSGGLHGTVPVRAVHSGAGERRPH